MLDAISYLGYVLLALLGFGFVIAIHELGHFVFAKWAGVRVDVFSIGFGPVVWKRRIGETDYALSLLPLGGYVKMLGQEDVPSGEAQPAAPDPRSYLAKHAGWKALILLGGVLFNLVSSYIILLALVAWGMPLFQPVVGDVQAEVVDHRGLPVASPASRLGLVRGDRLVAVDGEQVRSFEDVMTEVLFAGGRPLEVEIERGGRRMVLPPPGAAPVEPVFDGRFGRPSLGIEFPWSNRVVLAVNAPEDGLRRFDRILAIDGEDVSGLIGQDLQDRLLRRFGTSVRLTVQRGGGRVEVPVVYAGSGDAFDVRAGVPVRLAVVPAGSPAGEAGLRPGDWAVAVDGAAVAGATHFHALVRAGLDARGAVRLAVQRGGERIEVEVAGRPQHGVLRLGVTTAPVDAGVLAVLPPALDGGPGLLARTGLKPGDALVGWTPRERDVAIAWITGGTALSVPLGLDAGRWREENRYHDPGLVARLVDSLSGSGRQPGLADLLVGTRVVAAHAAAIELQPLDGPPRSVTRARLGPAAAALEPGDWLVDARQVGDQAVLEVVRGASPEVRRAVLDPPPLGTGIVLAQEELPYRAEGLADGLDLVNDAAYNLVVKGVMLIPRLFRPAEQGGVDPNKTLTGPIGIFRALKARAELMGFDSFLKLLALVGLNLFVVNLLPIPITDGGQLLMLGIETAMRRPLPLWLRNGLMWLGVGFVGLLFAYICGLDILRIFGLG